jgi:hypothetical protein
MSTTGTAQLGIGADGQRVARLEGEGGAAELDSKALKRRLKQEVKLRRDADRPPASFERFKILMEVVNEGRQVVDLADHKARYALVVLGALNAGVFFVLSRGHLIATLPAGAKPWLIGFLIVYAALTFVFVLHAVGCLWPRQIGYARQLAAQHGPAGLLYWEAIAAQELESYQGAWSEARMGRINAEVVIIAHRLSRLIRTKYVSLGRLYTGLVVLGALAVLILAIYTAFALVA